MSAETERPVFKADVTEQIAVTAHIGYGRSVSLEISPAGVFIDVRFEPHEARTLANILLTAADAAER